MTSNIHFKRYERFIASRPKRNIIKEVGYEIHHILPLALGGSNDSKNLIKLTYREHFIAHLILWKCYGNKMTYAFHLLATTSRTKQHLTSRQFETVRKEFMLLEQEKEVSEVTRRKISESLIGNTRHKGKKHSADARKKMSIAHANKPSWNKGKPCTWRRKQVRCIETGELYDSALAVIKILGKGGLYDHLAGHNLSYAGFHWEYVS